MIGSRSTPKGGFGNRLLNYISMRQLSRELGVGFFMPNRLDGNWVQGIHRPPRIPSFLRSFEAFSRDQVLEPGFVALAQASLASGRSVVLKPRLLTEALARFDFVPSASLVKHRFKLCKKHAEGEQAPIVLHLRGTDFADWKPNAVLGEGFYRDSLSWLDSQGYSDSPVRICTEDNDHPALASLKRFLRRKHRLVDISCESPFDCDYASLIAAQHVVSSPSTYAITACLLGSASVIHNYHWVDSRIREGDLFWQKVRENSIKGYNVLAEL